MCNRVRSIRAKIDVRPSAVEMPALNKSRERRRMLQCVIDKDGTEEKPLCHLSYKQCGVWRDSPSPGGRKSNLLLLSHLFLSSSKSQSLQDRPNHWRNFKSISTTGCACGPHSTHTHTEQSKRLRNHITQENTDSDVLKHLLFSTFVFIH